MLAMPSAGFIDTVFVALTETEMCFQNINVDSLTKILTQLKENCRSKGCKNIYDACSIKLMNLSRDRLVNCPVCTPPWPCSSWNRLQECTGIMRYRRWNDGYYISGVSKLGHFIVQYSFEKQ